MFAAAVVLEQASEGPLLCVSSSNFKSKHVNYVCLFVVERVYYVFLNSMLFRSSDTPKQKEKKLL